MARKAGLACALLQWGMECINHVYHMIQISEMRSFLLCLEINHYFTPSQPQCSFKWLLVAADMVGGYICSHLQTGRPLGNYSVGNGLSKWNSPCSRKGLYENPMNLLPWLPHKGSGKKPCFYQSLRKKMDVNTRRLRLLQVGRGRDHSWPNGMVKEDELQASAYTKCINYLIWSYSEG